MVWWHKFFVASLWLGFPQPHPLGCGLFSQSTAQEKGNYRLLPVVEGLYRETFLITLQPLAGPLVFDSDVAGICDGGSGFNET